MHILLLTVLSYLGLQVKFRRLLKVFFTVVKTHNIESTIRSIFKIILFLFGCAVLLLCGLFSLVVVSRGYSVAAGYMLLILVTSLVEHGL